MELKESILYSKALSFAAEKHSEQTRKNGTPYILHPVKVSMILARQGYDARYQIVALFHDLLEDTDATEEDLRIFCDDEMITAIKLVTKHKGQPESEYIDNILNNTMAKAVKNADRIDNLSDLVNSNSESFKEKYMKETKEFFLGRFSKELDDVYYGIQI